MRPRRAIAALLLAGSLAAAAGSPGRLGEALGLRGRAAADGKVVLRIGFLPGCVGWGTLMVLADELLVLSAPVSWHGPGLLQTDGAAIAWVSGTLIDGARPVEVVLLGPSLANQRLFSAPARPLPAGATADYEVAVVLDCSQVPYRVVGPTSSTQDAPEGADSGPPIGPASGAGLLAGAVLVAATLVPRCSRGRR